MGAAMLAATLTGLATGLGALPFLFVRELPRRVYDGILGLGAGLMLAAATLGLLAEALADVRQVIPGGHGTTLNASHLLLVVAGFSVGVGIAAAMDRLIPHRHARGHHQHLGHEPGHDHHDRESGHTDPRRGYTIIGALTIHRVPEGLAIGAGFAAVEHARLGLLLAIAVGLQNACEGIVMAAPLRQGGVAPGRSTVIITLTGLATPLAALAGGLLAGRTAPTMPFILALAAGTLIYVTSNEIIPESHSHGNEGTASGGVVAGFLLTMVLGALLP
jgi:ZIP family zinc transporter